jgi:hypothetical protein
MSMETEQQIDLVGAKRYTPVGACIYCRETGCRLTDEHIVPYALNGNWVLPRASCDNCAYITGQLIEQKVLRGELRHLRTALSFQTRSPSERPTVVRIKADEREIEVPIHECPILMGFIVFPPPGILVARQSVPGIDAIGTITIRWGPDPKEFAAKNEIKELSFQSKLHPAEFARMIAKIAYSWVVARFGLRLVAENLISPVILGSSDRIGYLIGCTKASMPTPRSQNEHVF